MQTVTVSSKTIEQILARLDKLTSEVRAIKSNLFKEEPRYGSNEWWGKEEREADEDIRAGRVMQFNSVKEAIKWLNS